jgi:microcystin degradation protein MlrC
MGRVLLACLWQESNRFVPTFTNLDDFRRCTLLSGSDVINGLRAGDIEISGIIHAAEESGIDLLPALAAIGMCGGPLTNETYAFLRQQVLDYASRYASDLDGAIFAFHGAMLTQELDDPEGDLLNAIRQILGPDKPVVCSLDLHAYITPQMLKNSTALVAYHTHPHEDYFDTGYRAMKLLDRILRHEVQPKTAFRKLRLIAQAERHNTKHGPMAEVMRRVLELEREPGILAVAIFPEHELLDVPNLGLSVIVVADREQNQAEACVETIANLIWQKRDRFYVSKTPVADALQIARQTPGGPVVMADGSDATSGGSAGDGNWLLRGLLQSPMPGPCLLTITDPPAVAQCITAGVGSEITVEVGGKLVPAFSQPVSVKGIVRTIADGIFRMHLPSLPIDIGRTAVLQTKDIFLVLSERPAWTFDEEVYHRVGLFPQQAKLVQVKAHGGFRPVYEPFAKAIIELDTPGPCNTDVRQLPYQNMSRPIYPIDDVQDAEKYYEI